MQRGLCDERIRRVREIARDPELAYAARTRLNRAILACTRLVARETGLAEPKFPGRYEPPAEASHHLKRVCDLTNRILDRSRSMCQPSEPLDDRWSDGWSEILDCLDELELSLAGAR
jgi:hypothetical protein